jgi:hypothetical protein
LRIYDNFFDPTKHMDSIIPSIDESSLSDDLMFPVLSQSLDFQPDRAEDEAKLFDGFQF